MLDAIGLIHAVQGSDCAVLLRVEENRPVPIKRALDIGLSGLMVPAVSSRAEAEACVAACRYAPRGNRGMAAPVVRATGHGAHWQGYVAAAKFVNGPDDPEASGMEDSAFGAAMPEPATGALMALGLAGLGSAGRRRR